MAMGSSAITSARCKVHTKPVEDGEGQSGPEITLIGDTNITLNVGENYVEKGAKATDGNDGDITGKIVISGNVNTSKAGTYTITYTVEDKAKNKAM